MARTDMSKMGAADLKARLAELLADRVRLSAKVQAGTDQKAAELRRAVRKGIARVHTLLRERERTQG
ncbi:50S ribosomal protein L29 [Candidatus Woesearchaeota archaeon]|nr:50S ribosomal protein L29 [Candidatus Woesearchaeota archaeon]